MHFGKSESGLISVLVGVGRSFLENYR